MKKLTRILMMMLVLSVGTGITSCDEIEDMIDNPVVPEPTPTPTPQPEPQPTPEEIENQRIAEAQALLEESRQEGALVNLTYTVNGVERVASFKRVGDKYVLQNPSATRADGAEGDEYVPYLMDYDTDEDPENDQDLDDADLDKDIEEEFEYEDGDDDLDDDDLDDDDTENLDNDAIADQLEWDDTTDDDDDDDAADGEDDDEATAGTRAMKQEIPYKYCCSIAGFRGITTLADCTQALLMPRTATFTQSFAIVAENFRTRSQEPVMAFTGKIEVNGKTFTYKPSEAGTRASNSKTVKVKSSGNMRITKVVFKKMKKLTYNKGNKMQVQVLPTNAKVKKVTWKAKNCLILASLPKNGTYHKIISTCKVTPNIMKKVTIKCTASGKGKKTKEYKVIVVFDAVKEVTISPSSLTFTEGDQAQKLTATVTPISANPSVTWKSDKEDVATVDGNGYVTPKGVGTATITCTSVDNPQKTASCEVTVNAAEVPISSLKLSQTSLSLFVGGTATLTAEVNSDATTKTVTWSVSEGTAVTVDQTGKVTAVAAGDATITAKAGEKTATCTVTVSKKAGSISFKESTVNVGNTASPFTNTLTNTGDGTVTYTISDNTCGATIDASTGKVTFTQAGSVTITATVADGTNYSYATKTATYTLSVSDTTDGSGGVPDNDDYTGGGNPF